MRILARLLRTVLFVVAMAPSAAFAQASIAGTVRDSSGAVLPGATVEAASPTLIEKVRTAVTDSTGQYRIENLRPGTYAVTFSLTGFSAVKRDGIELAGSFAATVNAELKVGSVEETITVSGESPIVDVQSGNRQKVLSSEVLTGIPTGRTQFTAATLIPGMNLNNQDVGGTNIINTTGGSMTIHGSNANDQRVMIDGLSTANSELAGQASNFLPNMGSTQEMSVDYSAGTADQMTGGVRINMIPRDGGNTFKGSIFATGSNSSFQADNYDQSLKDRGLRTPNSVKMNYDINPGFGGPLEENKVWFYGSARWVKTQNYVGGMFVNKNAGIQNVWTYDPDLNNPAFLNATQRSVNLRLTWQASATNKLSFFADDQGRCQCRNVTATMSPEAAIEIKYPIQRMMTAAWTSTVSSRLLFEVRGGLRQENYKYSATPAGDPYLKLIMVTEQASVNGAPAGLVYHGGGIGGATFTQPFQNTYGRNIDAMATATYVTGSHSFKAGFSDTVVLRNESLSDNDYHVSYRFNNGVPNQITERTTPYLKSQRQPAGVGVFAQDKWTIRNVTLNAGLRFDYLKIFIPAQHLDPAPLVPGRNLDLAETDLVSWKDLTPRLAVAYDVTSDGKTAVKASINKYVIAQGVQGVYGDQLAPVNRLANFVTRNWTDGNRNFVPDCDLTSPLDQNFLPIGGDRCFAMSDQNFGKPTPSVAVDPAVMNGLRRPSLQLGVLGGRPAPDRVADVRGVRVFPPLVRQLRRHGQPGARRDGFLAVQRHVTGGPAAARRRRRHHVGVPRREQDCRDQQLLHCGRRLREPDSALERLRSDGERPAAAGRAAPGRLQHGQDADRQLRDPGEAAGNQPARRTVLPPGDAVPHPGEALRRLYAAEGRRADQRRLPEHPWPAAGREPGDSERPDQAVARARSDRRRR